MPTNEERKWKILEKTELVKSKYINLVKEKVELPSGHILNEYFISEKNDGTIIFPITEDKKILTITQYKHGAQTVIHELPAGMIDKGETPEQAGKRELQEE